MKNIYDNIWSDAFLSFRKYNPKEKDWKFKVFFFLTFINALNFGIILLWLKFFKLDIVPSLKLDLFPGTMIDDFLGFAIVYWLPMLILNFFLIIYRDRYKMITTKYPLTDKKYAFKYTAVILFLTVASIALYQVIK